MSKASGRPINYTNPSKGADELRKLYDVKGYRTSKTGVLSTDVVGGIAGLGVPDSVLSEYVDLKNLKRGFTWWVKRAAKFGTQTVSVERDALIKVCLQKAYLDSTSLPESFYMFCRDIVGYPDLEANHIPMCDTVADTNKYSMLQACRDTFKSSLSAAAYPSWLCGRDYFINDNTSTVRILLASEVMALAKRNLDWCKQIMDWDRAKVYKPLCGDHRGQTGWTWAYVLSKYRVDPRIGGPTISYSGVDSDRTGFHYDYIICDDVQAERQSSSREQIDVVWNFYQLLFSLLEI